MNVKVIAVDEQDRVKLSRKAAMRDQEAAGRQRQRRLIVLAESRVQARRPPCQPHGGVWRSVRPSVQCVTPRAILVPRSSLPTP